MLSTINSWPHNLQLSDTEETTVICEQPLRNLPGKRLVCRATWNNRAVLVKLFLHPKSSRRHWLREKNGTKLLADNNLSTPTMLFAGTLNDSTPILIFKFVPMAATALEQWQKCSDDKQRLTLLKALVTTIADQHYCGIWQQDIHLDNFLIRDEKIYTIDGDGVRTANGTGPLVWGKKQANLALFFAQLPPQYDHLLPAVLAHYLSQHNDHGEDNDTFANQQKMILQLQLPQARRCRRKSYIDKAYRSCSEFIRHNSFRRVCIYRRDINQTLLQAIESNPDLVLEQATILKDGNSATVGAINLDGHNLVIKRYNIKNFWHGLKRCWRPTRAWVSWGNAHRLLISNIDTPQAVAVIEKRWGPLRLGGYYICAAVDGPSADKYLLDPLANRDDKRIIKEKFLELFRILHQLKITHGDCKASNFLIHNNRLYVIDLDAMNECHWQPLFIRGFISDRARFLRNWDSDPELQHWFDKHLIGS